MHVAFLGLGAIGRQFARIAGGIGMRVIAWTMHPRPEPGVELVPLEDLLREADVVSVHLRLSPETRGFLDRTQFALMKPSAILINTARGPIVDETALIAALKAERIAGAGLDVFDREPLPAGHPLTALPNVVLTPHIGWPTDQGYEKFADAACDVLIAYLNGRDVPQFESH